MRGRQHRTVALEAERFNKNSAQQLSIVGHWATQSTSWTHSFFTCKMAMLMPPGQLAVNERCSQGPWQNFRHRTGPCYYSGKAFRQECSQKRSIHHDKMLPLSTSNQSKHSNGDEPRVITYTRGSGVPLMESKSQSESNKPIHTYQNCLFSKALGTFLRNLV